MNIVIKFWKEDFRYIERHSYYNNERGDSGYCYTFAVR